MSYKFQPKTEDEVQAEQLCPEGKYPFTVLESSLVLSKSEKNAGKPQIKLKLNVHGDDGFDYHVYDYVADWFMAHKFRHFFVCTGHEKAYESGDVDPSNNAFAGWEGWCDLTIQKAKGSYPARNSVSDYVIENAISKAAAEQPAAKGNEDDCPF